MTQTTAPAQTTATTTAATPRAAKAQGAIQSAVRIVVSFLFLCHGLQGFGFFGGVDGAGGSVELGSWPGWYGSVIELVGAAFVLVGLFTRPVAVLLSGVMAYAYFTVHAPEGLLPLQNMGELSTLYCWIFLLIAAIGPGTFALDTLRRRR
ncbi:DoxX family protein [Amycolatopsis roodepoortensis]|uniref:Oxidoreductase n=1 Tax=Amycolatopsis roodepoortensis TaxID=700274 RepID=A0ABR9L5N7_9PSEU|nr:DoxX family protein [Amycolatopsis roodepoortensis]MBE1575672.1 putative oxidoreductase [Amycolatopsis roodepoortensis]